MNLLPLKQKATVPKPFVLRNYLEPSMAQENLVMEIFIGADHNGFKMKGQLISWLEELGHTVVDVGAEALDEHDDYPDYGIKVAEAVAADSENRRGVLVCGSGVGMAVVADKVPGVRAALIHDENIAEAAQRDDDINVLSLGASHININQAKTVIKTWLDTPFSGGARHVRRLGKIADYESKTN